MSKQTWLVVHWLRIAWQCREHNFNPWFGKIPHVAEQLSPCATTTEPVLWGLEAATIEPMCHNY